VALALLALLAVKLYRSGLETSLWMDEVYSLELVRHRLASLLDLARTDFSPPLYYFLLKGWLAAAARLGIPAGLFLARSLNVVVWSVLVAGTLVLGRHLRKPGLAPLLALAVAGSAHAVQFTQDLRSYGLAFTGLTLAFLLLVHDLERPADAGRTGQWIGYTACALVALWSHLLSWIVVMLAGSAWLALRLHRNRTPETRTRLRPGLVAHGVALLGAAPWLAIAVHQAGRLRAARPEWMTPPTPGNLLRVFVDWLPLGRNGAGGGRFGALALLLGGLALLPLLVAGLRALGRRPAAGGPLSGTAPAGAAGIAMSVLFVGALWLGHRAGWIYAFHGPRYPGLVGGVWAASLVLLAWGEATTAGARRAAWLALIPWLAASALADVRAVGIDRQGGLVAQRARLETLAGGEEGRLFYEPEGLAPYFRKTLAELRARPISNLFCDAPGDGRAVVLYLNRWRELDLPSERLLRYAFARGPFETLEHRELPAATRDFSADAVRVAGSGAALAAEWCQDGIRPRRPDALAALPQGASVALPEAQRASDGWSYLEFDDRLEAYRWSSAVEATIRFPDPFPAGAVDLRLVGYREPQPDRVATVAIEFPCGSPRQELELGPGPFDQSLRFELPATCRGARELDLRHPLWPTPSGDRRVGIQLRGAVLSRASR
jgi:hypothetical protein